MSEIKAGDYVLLSGAVNHPVAGGKFPCEVMKVRDVPQTTGEVDRVVELRTSIGSTNVCIEYVSKLSEEELEKAKFCWLWTEENGQAYSSLDIFAYAGNCRDLEADPDAVANEFADISLILTVFNRQKVRLAMELLLEGVYAKQRKSHRI